MNRKVKAGLAGAVALACLWAGAAEARQDTSEERQVRVGCDLQADGRLAHCTVMSRFGVDETYDDLALRIAGFARIWPMKQDIAPGPVHFPILFDVRSGEALDNAFPGPRLSIRRPVLLGVSGQPEEDHRTDRAAVFPPVAPGYPGQAWTGLNCVVSENLELKTCWNDQRETLPGLLADDFDWFMPVQTLSGEMIDLPEALPASPDEVRTTWRPIGLNGNPYFMKEVSGGGGIHLIWATIPDLDEEVDVGKFYLLEYDCPRQRMRHLQAFSTDGARIGGHIPYPNQWNSYVDYEDDTPKSERLHLDPYYLLCETTGG